MRGRIYKYGSVFNYYDWNEVMVQGRKSEFTRTKQNYGWRLMWVSRSIMKRWKSKYYEVKEQLRTEIS